MNYTKTSPCGLCPFRNDEKRLYVDPDRLREMASGEFVCHKTAEYDEGDDEGYGGGYVDNGKTSQHCAGALIFLEHANEPHQMMRIAERLRMYDRFKLDMNAPVFQSWEEVEDAEDDPYGRARTNALTADAEPRAGVGSSS